MKIKQLTSYPIPNEIGLGNTNESYIRIENDINVSDIFPPNEEVVVTDCITGKSYKLKAKVSAEYRINQLGQIYRDYNFYPGDEIKFTQIDDNGKKTVFFSVTNFNRAYICVGPKGTEIVNYDRIAGYYLTATKTYNIPVDEGTLKLVFDKLEKKRNDSPNDTEFYCSTVNDVNLNKGIYFITIDGNKAVLEREKKNKVEEFFTLDGNNEKSVYTKDFPLQTIYYGAPGTGKSNTIKREVEDKGRIHFRTTFHPDSDYSTFVGCYKPTMVEAPVRDGSGHEVKEAKQEEKNRITYSFVPQAFTKAYCEAWNQYDGTENSEPVFLVIEEINRGNCAQIFGDVFQLLDRETEGDRCGFSTYPIDADEDLKKFLMEGTHKDGTPWLVNKEGIKNNELCLPPNLHIWATMNTSDQSLFPIDSAFKRRWDWKYVPINYEKANWTIKTKSKDYSWSSFLKNINQEIDEVTHSEDKMLGFYFCKATGGEISADILVNKVLFYIYNDVFKDYGFDREMFKGEDGKVISFRSYYNADGSMNEDQVVRFLDNLKVEEADDVDNNVAPQESEDVAEDKLTETEQLRKSYWDAFIKYANSSNGDYRQYFGRRKTPSTDKWYNFSIKSNKCHLVVEQTRSRKELSTGLYIPNNMELFYKLLDNKESIERELNFQLDWRELPEKQASYIVAIVDNIDFEASGREKSQFDMIINRLLRMREAFKKYLD